MKLLSRFRRARQHEADEPDALKLVRDNFDPEFYRAGHPGLAGACDEDLLTDYVQQGWNEGRDPVDWFSVQDYLHFYDDVKTAGIDPFYHFLAHGKAEGRLAPPSRGSEERAARFFADLYGRFITEFPPEFDPPLYMLATGLEGTSRWTALAHFILYGAFDPRILAILQPEADLLSATGDCHFETDVVKALQCYAHAEQVKSGTAALKRKIGACYARLQHRSSARSTYRDAIDAGDTSYSTCVQFGSLSLELGFLDDAVEYLGKAFRLRGGDYRTLHSCRQAASERFQADVVRALALSCGGKDVEARHTVHSAVTTYQGFLDFEKSNPLVEGDREKRRKIALLGNDVLSQCKLYRITQKIDQLARKDVAVEFYPLAEVETLSAALIGYDCIIVYRAPITPELMLLVHKACQLGITTFYDIDDLIFEDDSYPPPRDTLEDMLSPGDFAGLVIGSVLFREAMALCDYGIASTPTLQKAMAQVVRRKRCFLSRNALGQLHLSEIEARPGKTPPNDKFVFFYGSGSRSHNRNFAVLAKPVARILKENPETELRIVGALALGPEFTDLGGRITCLPFTNTADYWRELAAADVNLAPLENSRFNDAKSEIKWMEAGMFGVPSVVSRSAVYEEIISDGHDGFLADGDEQWASTLQRLVDDKDLGVAVGACARSKVLSDYGLEKGSSALLSILDPLMSGPGTTADRSGGLGPNKRPLVLVVNIFYPPDDVGGATRVVEQTVSDILAASATSLSFEILCGREYDGKPGSFERYEWNDVPVTSLSPFTDIDGTERSSATAAFFAQFLDRVRPDIIHFHCIQKLGISLLEVAHRKNIPFVVTAHDGWWISDHQFLVGADGVPVWDAGNWGNADRLNALRSALNRAVATIAVSHAHARLYEERGVKNVITVPNGSAALEGVSAPPDQGAVWLGLLGGLGMAKGGDLLREVLTSRHYPNLRFLVVDHGMEADAVRYELWGENKIEVWGKTSFENVAKVYSRLHVVLAVSLCIESFGLVAREAQRLRRWVIASNRGGMGEDVRDGVNGFIVDPSKADQFAGVLDMINADPARFLVAPPQSGELRGLQEVAADYLTIYRSILAGEKVVRSTVLDPGA